MENTSRDLMREHESILIALDVIERMNERILNGDSEGLKDIKEIIDFLKLFADKCHHGKEELYLFPALEEAGVKNQGGPIGVMLEQHRQGRDYIKQMENSFSASGINRNAFTRAASSYVTLLRNHIEKENTLLFPISDSKLSAFKQQELMRNFENLEKEVIGEGIHEELHILLNRLRGKYIPE